MERLSQLKTLFASKAIAPETWFLLRNSDAQDYIRTGHELGFRLLGVDGFRITAQGAFQPMQEWSNDVHDYNGIDFVSETLAFISKLSPDATFEVVFEEN